MTTKHGLDLQVRGFRQRFDVLLPVAVRFAVGHDPRDVLRLEADVSIQDFRLEIGQSVEGLFRH